ncbi:MAG: ABC transporter permease, partial [bacterium]|nr:ABC transporter permease [bacterium]
MSPTRRIFELAKRDFTQRAKSKAFLMAMVLTVGIVLILGPLIALASGDPEPSRIALVGEQPAGSDEAIRQQATALDIDIRLERFPDLAAAEIALTEGDVAVVVDGTSELVFQEESSLRLSAAITGGIATAQRQINAAEMGLSAEEVGLLLFPLQFNERTVEPSATDEDEATELAALVGLMLLYISILMFGQFVMMGVMEEKQTRVVEVVLSRVKPTQVLIGKVLGIGLLGLIQIVAMSSALIFT